MGNKLYWVLTSVLLLACIIYGLKLNTEIDHAVEDSQEIFARIDRLHEETQELSAKVDELPEDFIFIIPKENIEVEKTEYIKKSVPLSLDLQEYTYLTCKKKDVDYNMVLAMMDIESKYDETAISDTGDYGLMQLNIKAQEMTPDEALNPRTNIEKGVDIISNLMDKYEEPHIALMAYNCGESGARRLWNDGVYSTEYTIKIMAKTKELKSDGEMC